MRQGRYFLITRSTSGWSDAPIGWSQVASAMPQRCLCFQILCIPAGGRSSSASSLYASRRSNLPIKLRIVLPSLVHQFFNVYCFTLKKDGGRTDSEGHCEQAKDLQHWSDECCKFRVSHQASPSELAGGWRWLVCLSFASHPTSCMSAAEIMAVLFHHTMKYDGESIWEKKSHEVTVNQATARGWLGEPADSAATSLAWSVVVSNRTWALRPANRCVVYMSGGHEVQNKSETSKRPKTTEGNSWVVPVNLFFLSYSWFFSNTNPVSLRSGGNAVDVLDLLRGLLRGWYRQHDRVATGYNPAAVW